MQEFKVKFVSKRDEAKGTKTFVFAKPEGFEYIAGQYAYFTLPELKFPDSRGKIRHFTLSTSPTEDFLSITLRLREQSGFKMTLDSLPEGTEIDFRGPTGDFVIDPSNASGQVMQVMIAGGIGITPYRSIIKYVSDKGLKNEIHLIYANSHEDEITFKTELDQIISQNSNINVTYFVSEPGPDWKGEKGRISEDFLNKMENGKLKMENAIYWLCGPPPMVSALEEVLDKLKIPQEQIKVEKFTGY